MLFCLIDINVTFFSSISKYPKKRKGRVRQSEKSQADHMAYKITHLPTNLYLLPNFGYSNIPTVSNYESLKPCNFMFWSQVTSTPIQFQTTCNNLTPASD